MTNNTVRPMIISQSLPVFTLIIFFAIVPHLLSAEYSPALGIPQIFVDDEAIADRKGVVRTIHPGKKLDAPVLAPELPWEGDRVYIYGTAYYDPTSRQFRMWYLSKPPSGGRDRQFGHDKRSLVLYATSVDGIQWNKPRLGVYNFAGSTENNIVYDVDSPSVLVDLEALEPKSRYRMMGQSKKKHAHISESADGVHWTGHSSGRAFRTKDTVTWTRDPRTGQYIAFFKLVKPSRGHRRRLIYSTTSSDLKKWSEPILALEPDEVDDAWAVGPDQHTDYYSMSVFPYGGQFLGLVPTFRIERRFDHKEPDQSADDGPIDVQLVHSRDGRGWKHTDPRTPIIDNGPAEFDAGCILGVANSPVICGDEMWFYYTGVTTPHGGTLPEKRISIGRAAWRLDGMVSLDAADEEAIVETVPFEFTGEQVVVNADASRGTLTVEVTDADGNPLEGLTQTDCVPLQSDDIRHAVQWSSKSSPQAGKKIRLRFYLQNATLYSYTLK